MNPLNFEQSNKMPELPSAAYVIPHAGPLTEKAMRKMEKEAIKKEKKAIKKEKKAIQKMEKESKKKAKKLAKKEKKDKKSGKDKKPKIAKELLVVLEPPAEKDPRAELKPNMRVELTITRALQGSHVMIRAMPENAVLRAYETFFKNSAALVNWLETKQLFITDLYAHECMPDFLGNECMEAIKRRMTGDAKHRPLTGKETCVHCDPPAFPENGPWSNLKSNPRDDYHGSSAEVTDPREDYHGSLVRNPYLAHDVFIAAQLPINKETEKEEEYYPISFEEYKLLPLTKASEKKGPNG